jgi:hypothetical protein
MFGQMYATSECHYPPKCRKTSFGHVYNQVRLVTIQELVQADSYRFFMFVVHNKRGDIGLEAATFGEAQYIAICLGMHREDVSSIVLDSVHS